MLVEDEEVGVYEDVRGTRDDWRGNGCSTPGGSVLSPFCAMPVSV